MENLEKNIKNKLMEIGMTISDLATKSDLTKQKKDSLQTADSLNLYRPK